MTALLDVRGLCTEFRTRSGAIRVVNDVSFSVGAGEIVGLVGESGSGKSMTAFSIMGLVDPPGRIAGGVILFRGTDIARLTERGLRALRGDRIAMVFQDPMMTLNPVLSIGTQMVETIRAHRKVPRRAARAHARDVLGRVGIPSPEERLGAYPHQFSGGMRQRVAIAIALLNDPDLIIADEPTTALDVTVQAQIVAETQRLSKERGVAFLWITHDLGLLSGFADSLAVMYASRIVERGRIETVLAQPAHPYTRGLIESLPAENRRRTRLYQIPGAIANLAALPPGCSFKPRCDRATAACDAMPDLHAIGDSGDVRCHHPLRPEAVG